MHKLGPWVPLPANGSLFFSRLIPLLSHLYFHLHFPLPISSLYNTLNRSGYSVLEPLRVLSDAVHRVVHSVCAPGLRVGHRNALLCTLNRSFGLVTREAEQLEVGDVAVAGITIPVIELRALPSAARPLDRRKWAGAYSLTEATPRVSEELLPPLGEGGSSTPRCPLAVHR